MGFSSYVMGTCSICKKISAGGDHLDCMEKRRVELEYEDPKPPMEPSDELAVEIRALLDHITRGRDKDYSTIPSPP